MKIYDFNGRKNISGNRIYEARTKNYKKAINAKQLNPEYSMLRAFFISIRSLFCFYSN